jgi:hypothetical protein
VGEAADLEGRRRRRRPRDSEQEAEGAGREGGEASLGFPGWGCVGYIGKEGEWVVVDRRRELRCRPNAASPRLGEDIFLKFSKLVKNSK